MLEWKLMEKEFKIFYKGCLFIHHTEKDPAFEIGIAKGKYRMRMGDFKIRDKLKRRIPLSNYRILSEGEGTLRIELNSNDHSLDISINENTKTDCIEIYPECNDKKINRFWIKIKASQEEAIFGCGEQFSEINMRGKELPLFVEEQGVGRGDPPITGDWYTTYFPQPTYISSHNYFCHIETFYYSKFNFKDPQKHVLYIWEIPNKIILGKYNSLIETVSKLSSFLGRQPKLVDWVYDGLWLGLQGGREVVNAKISKAKEHNISVNAVWCQDWEGINMTSQGKQLFWNWEYDEELYPDLPQYIEELNKSGIKFLGYINPYLNDKAPLHDEALEKGCLIKIKDGEILYDDSTAENCFGILDLSNPQTFDWIKSVIIKNMIEIGMDGYMCDYGEYTPIDVSCHSGISGEEFHNQYPVLWAKVNYEALKKSDSLDKVTFFMRSGYTHSSKYAPMIWAGDQLVTWSIDDGLASVIPAGISAGLCGIGYFHFDIGGFHSLGDFKRTKEVFMRWAELAAFSVVMRTHEGIRPWDNWQFDSDKETLEHLSKMVKVHVHLKPYLERLSEEYQKKGLPIMRGCFLHYPDDIIFHNLKYQYLLGADLLIAPVIKPKKSLWRVYLPKDLWIHIWNGDEYEGGWTNVQAPIGKPPVFYRKDSQFAKLFSRIKDI
ncbi:MAG: Sulfoquinovosidase [Promethearchaeota archaeon]|nr:MAG: Sulfoquinovosidase [Candidatus Lokiarchaeota archaeon]